MGTGVVVTFSSPSSVPCVSGLVSELAACAYWHIIRAPNSMKTQVIHPMSKLFGAVVSALLFCSFGTALRAAEVIPDHSTYFELEPMTISFQGPGNRLDWVGIYPVGVVPGTGTASTRWLYVDGTQTGSTGLTEGSVTFTDGLYAGDWVAYLLLNDGYTVLGSTPFRVVDQFSTPFIRLDESVYAPGSTISVAFTNGPGNSRDWLGVYAAPKETPDGTYLDWLYISGTQIPGEGKTEGVVQFTAPAASGSYVMYLLQDDSSNPSAFENFIVREAVSKVPRVISISPTDGTTNLSPVVEFLARITNGTVSKLATNSVHLKIDGALVAHSLVSQDGLATVSYTNSVLYTPLSGHSYEMVFSDDAVPAASFTNSGSFAVTQYTNIVLPAPIYFENFDTTPEGQLPAGWTSKSYSIITDENYDLQDLNSKSYADWVVVSCDRFNTNFLSYADHASVAYSEVLTPNPLNVVNGQLRPNLASGRFAFSTSGYREGDSEYVILTSPDFNLSGTTNVYMAFNSLWEQNQDSIASVEYSIDQGQTWLPLLYMLATGDIVTDESGAVDAVTTFNDPHGDVAFYVDPDSGATLGGYYGAYIGATVSPDLAPYISARYDDDPVGSKRVEIFKLPLADNESKVRFRFAHSGTDSWYFGVDDFGLYSFSTAQPKLSIARTGANLIISWPADVTGYTLEMNGTLSGTWQVVPGVANNSVTLTIESGQKYFRLKK
jgi:hypothetical protein